MNCEEEDICLDDELPEDDIIVDEYGYEESDWDARYEELLRRENMRSF